MQAAGLVLAVQTIATIGTTIAGIVRSTGESSDAKAEADSIRAQTRIAEEQDRRASRRIIAKQQAGAAAAGLDISSGSPLELTLDSALEAEKNALNIRYTGELRRQSKLREARLARGGIAGSIFEGAAGLGSIFSRPSNRRILSNFFRGGKP